MAVNLLDSAKSYLSDDVIGQVSNMLGEKPQNTQKAFDGALPAILSGLVQKSIEPGGTSSIMDMIGEVMAPNRAAGEAITPSGGILSHLSTLFTNGSQSSTLLSVGASIIQRLFGDKAGAVAGAVASYSGIKQSSASSLLSIAGPVLLSLLGKKLADDGTGVSGIAGLLSNQASYIQSAVPVGLSSLLGSIPGLSFLGGFGSKIGDLTSSVTEPVTRVTPSAVNVPPARPAPAPVYTEDDDRSSGGGNRWLPWLLLLLGAAALFYFLRSCGKEKETVSTTTETTVDSTSSAMSNGADTTELKIGEAVDSAGNALKDATAKLGAFFKRKLPSGLELNIPEFGIENNLVKFIEDTSKPVDKTTWFNFDRLLFDTGKATLRPESQEQLTNIAAILKEYPNVHIKLGGYTDNTGSAEVNKKLSQERADSVMGELIRLGIDKSRLEAEGYGPEYPVASNDTEAGRAENRRIAIRVTQK
ncbi:OmpA family protein [Spirosoma validum]|nr:OmpA family protein [Spirosoma validum]